MAKKSLLSGLWREHKPVVYILLLAIGLCVALALFVWVHFKLGIKTPLVSLKAPEALEYWGQIGDFIGGILNPSFSFIAFVMLLYTLKVQSDELSEARKESQIARRQAKAALQLQALQTRIFERQSFESAFFGLLNSHIRILDSIEFVAANGQVFTGHDAIVQLTRQYSLLNRLAKLPNQPRVIALIRANARAIFNQYQGEIGPYFRSLYHLLNYVDSYGEDALNSPLSLPHRPRPTSWAHHQALFFEQRQYADMLSAQLSSAESDLIFLHCLTVHGKPLRHYVEKFSLLKAFNQKRFSQQPKVLALYRAASYKDTQALSKQELSELLHSPWPPDEDQG